MRKKNLLLLLLICICYSAMSQVTTNVKVLQNFAHQHRLKEDVEYKNAVAIANKNGWPIIQVGKNGSVMTLQSINDKGFPVYYVTYNNIIAAATTRANQLWPGGSSGLSLSGSSSSVSGKLGIWDAGLILKNHVEFVPGSGISRVLQKDSSTAGALGDHATHTSGTMIASGVNPIAKGMAFGLQQLIGYSTNRNEISNMTAESANLLLSNHSYGFPGGWYNGSNGWSWYGDTLLVNTVKSDLCGHYGDNNSGGAQLYDSISFNAPYYQIVFAAGNSNGNNAANGQGPALGTSYLYNGAVTKTRTANIPNNPTYGSISGGQTAKNMLVVGAVNGLPNGYSSPNDVQIGDFSSWGPTNDGRIKPDIVADGINVTSTVSTTTTSYGTESGTSMSSPNATGSLLLLQEYYNQKHPGVFMRASTLKALAIHTADEAGLAPGPDYIYGYGLLNVLKASSVITSSFNNKTDSIIEKTLTSGTPYTFNVVASGNGPLKATIAWTDHPGYVDNVNYFNTNPELVNDLDLKITSGSSTYYPWILNPNVPTAAATKGIDNVNNMEQVQIDSVVPGKTYTITVSNKGTLVTGSQAFSIIISGMGGNAYCTSASTNTTGSRIDSVSFSNVTNKNTAGHSSYSNFTNLTANIQPNQTIPISIKINSSDASSANRVVKVYMDYNNNGTFTDAGEFVASNVSNISSISGTGGIFTANITTPNGLTIGNYGVMRIVLQDSTSGTATVGPCTNYTNGETQDYRYQVVSPSHDISVLQVISPVSGSTFNNSQLLSVQLKNVGTIAMSNISLTASIKNGTTTVANLTGTFPATVSAGNTMIYTFQTPFNLSASTTYNFVVTATTPGDQLSLNDTLLQSITTSPKAVVNAIAELCGTSTAYFRVINPSASKYLWYTATPINNSVPFFIGPVGATSSIPTNNTFYVSSGLRTTIGPADNTVYGTGGYGSGFNGYYTYDSAAVPLIIETAKIYANAAGQVKIVAKPAFTTSSGISYYPSLGDSVIVDVYPDINGNDLGNNYYLNLHLDNSVTNSYIISFSCLNGASIYRNNAVSSSPYPIGIPNIFQITTNLVASPNNYYYFLYNMKIATMDSLSDVVTVNATTAPTPAISLSGSNLVSSITNALNYQWSLGGVSISGATSSTYAPTKSGSYTISVTDAFGCTRTSAAYNYVVTAVQNVTASEISLVISPNPNNGVFHVGFTTNTKADVAVELINTSGQICLNNSYPNFVGQFSQQYSTNNLASGTYILKVQQNGKVYEKQIMIIK